jgi:hypothetical protein
VQTCKPAWIKHNLHEIDRAQPTFVHGLFRGTDPTAAAICTFARSIDGGGELERSPGRTPAFSGIAYIAVRNDGTKLREKQMSAEILTPESPRWGDFVDRLDAAVGTNCDGSHRCAERSLVEMRNINVPATLLVLEAFDGDCDCAVVTNVETGWLDRLGLLLRRIHA